MTLGNRPAHRMGGGNHRPWRSTAVQVDEEGNPVDEHGFPYREFNPSRVHPDDPCQSKAYS